MLQALVLAAGLVVAADGRKQGAISKEAEKLEGVWSVVKGDRLRKGEKWVIGQGQIREGDGDKFYRFYRLDPQASPKRIDVTIMAQPDGLPVVILQGIYALKDDELKVYFAPLGGERPAAFPEKAGPGQVLVLKRQKP